MKPEEAIKRLSTLPLASHDFELEVDKHAVNLDIEALKRIKMDRIFPHPIVSDLLPGETEE